MLSMIADEESEATSPSDGNGNKQLFPPTAAGLLPNAKNLSRAPSSEQEGKLSSVVQGKMDEETNEVEEWMTDLNDNKETNAKVEEESELHTIYLPGIGIIKVDAISEVWPERISSAVRRQLQKKNLEHLQRYSSGIATFWVFFQCCFGLSATIIIIVTFTGNHSYVILIFNLEN